MDKEWLMNLLSQNKGLNFVDRILNRDQYPSISFTNVDGEVGSMTHKMAWGEGNGKYFVYPTVVYDKEKKNLQQLDGRSAWDYAMNSKEYLQFDNPKTADWVSRNYKLAWTADQAKARNLK